MGLTRNTPVLTSRVRGLSKAEASHTTRTGGDRRWVGGKSKSFPLKKKGGGEKGSFWPFFHLLIPLGRLGEMCILIM